MKRILSISLVALPALSLLAVALVIVMLLSLNGDVAALTQRLSMEARTAKDVREQIAALKDELSALKETPSSEPATVVQPVPATAEPHAEQAAVARPVKVVASGWPECVFKAGDSSGLVTCIRSEQGRIAEPRMPTRYR
jgi:hypothetical protein